MESTKKESGESVDATATEAVAKGNVETSAAGSAAADEADLEEEAKSLEDLEKEMKELDAEVAELDEAASKIR